MRFLVEDQLLSRYLRQIINDIMTQEPNAALLVLHHIRHSRRMNGTIWGKDALENLFSQQFQYLFNEGQEDGNSFENWAQRWRPAFPTRDSEADTEFVQPESFHFSFMIDANRSGDGPQTNEGILYSQLRNLIIRQPFELQPCLDFLQQNNVNGDAGSRHKFRKYLLLIAHYELRCNNNEVSEEVLNAFIVDQNQPGQLLTAGVLLQPDEQRIFELFKIVLHLINIS